MNANIEKVNRTGVAYSYIRFSTPEQQMGDSERRQWAAAEAYCQAHGLKLADTVADKGVSAFHGKNHNNGNLGRLLKMMQPGDTLVVEDSDRWSRENPLDALNRLRAEVERGIKVVFLRTGQTVTADNFNNMETLVPAFFGSMLASQESQKKAERVKAAWDAKRAALAAGQAVDLSCLPRWLSWDDGAAKIVVNESKTAVVRDIFARAAKGETVIDILRALQDVPTFRTGKVRKWSAMGLRRLLKDKAVIGFCSLVKPAVQIYPSVVSEEQFYAVQAARKNVVQHVKVQHGNQTNLFTGLAVCGRCGEPLACHQPGHGYGPGLFCTGSQTKRSNCRWKCVPLPLVEEAVLALLGEANLIRPALASQGQANRLDELQGRLDAAKGQADKLFKVIDGDPTPSARVYAALKAAEAEAEAAGRALEEEKTRVKTEQPALETFDEFVRALPSLMADKAMRPALRRAIGAVIEKMTLDPAGTERTARPGEWPFENVTSAQWAEVCRHPRRQWQITVSVKGAAAPVSVWIFGRPVNAWCFESARPEALAA